MHLSRQAYSLAAARPSNRASMKDSQSVHIRQERLKMVVCCSLPHSVEGRRGGEETAEGETHMTYGRMQHQCSQQPTACVRYCHNKACAGRI